MRIAVPVFSAEMTGGQVVARALIADALVAGHEVVPLAPGPGPFVEACRGRGLVVRAVGRPRSFALDRALRLAVWLRRARVDLVHAHTTLPGNVLWRLAGRFARVPVVCHMHLRNFYRSSAIARGFQRRLDRWTASCSMAVAVAGAVRSALLVDGYPPECVTVIRNGVAMPPARARAPRGRRPVIAVVGRLCEAKGQDVLVEALARLAGEPELWLIGEDPAPGSKFRAALAARAEALGIAGRVRWLGQRSDVTAVLGMADVLAVPSRIEGLPLALLEGMAAGRAVVASAVDGIPEAIEDGKNGRLVHPEDPVALAAALGELLADPEKARALGCAARERVARDFTASRMCTEVLALYGRLGAGR